MKPILGLAPDSPSLAELGGVVWPIEIKNIPLAFNPAICRDSDGRLALVVRRTNYVLDTKFGALTIPSGARGVKNATYFSYLDDDLRPTDWLKISFTEGPKLERGPEDARLLRRGANFYLNVVMLERDIPRARIGLYRLDSDFSATHVETYPGKDKNKPEKNWMTVLESDEPNFNFVRELPNNLRGGSSLVSWQDGYLSICHKTYLNKNQYYNPMTFGIQEGVERTYTHVLAKFDKDFNLEKISKEFFLVNRGIEFATGLVELGPDFLISFGRDDKESWFGKISSLKVEKMLKEGA
jgi:hypothetical protein